MTDDYTLQEAAALTGLAASSLRRYIHAGKLIARKRGHDWFVTRAQLAVFLAARDNRSRRVKPIPPAWEGGAS